MCECDNPGVICNFGMVIFPNFNAGTVTDFCPSPIFGGSSLSAEGLTGLGVLAEPLNYEGNLVKSSTNVKFWNKRLACHRKLRNGKRHIRGTAGFRC